MNKTKIDWCDASANPIKGCPNNCEYCYGRKINDRFHLVKDWSKPEFFPEVLEQFKSKKPKSIFIDSMSDIGCWKDEWFEQVFKAMAENPQHKYIALTKCSSSAVIYKFMHYAIYSGGVKSKFFVGQSITTQKQVEDFKNIGNNDFFSIEPLLEPLDLKDVLHKTATVIIGAETGNRKGKVIPEKEWVQNIVNQCNEQGKIVFMKKSLREIMGDEFRQDRLPWGYRDEQIDRFDKRKSEYADILRY